MPKKILIIDDDKPILDAIAFLLEDSNYTVDTLSDGTQALAKINKYQPDVILLDVLMSGMDGREICKDIKAAIGTKTIPLIMMSASPNVKKSSTECGADAFLAKPFDTDELLHLIKHYV